MYRICDMVHPYVNKFYCSDVVHEGNFIKYRRLCMMTYLQRPLAFWACVPWKYKVGAGKEKSFQVLDLPWEPSNH
jgi:hypothetical protein